MNYLNKYQRGKKIREQRDEQAERWRMQNGLTFKPPVGKLRVYNENNLIDEEGTMYNIHKVYDYSGNLVSYKISHWGNENFDKGEKRISVDEFNSIYKPIFDSELRQSEPTISEPEVTQTPTSSNSSVNNTPILTNSGVSVPVTEAPLYSPKEVVTQELPIVRPSTLTSYRRPVPQWEDLPQVGSNYPEISMPVPQITVPTNSNVYVEPPIAPPYKQQFPLRNDIVEESFQDNKDEFGVLRYPNPGNNSELTTPTIDYDNVEIIDLDDKENTRIIPTNNQSITSAIADNIPTINFSQWDKAQPQEIEITQQDVLPSDVEVIDLDNALNKYNMNGPKFGYRSPAQWDNPTYDDTTPDNRNFLQKGWDMIKEDMAKKREARQKYRDIWQDRADRRDEIRDKIRDARRIGRALGKNERLGIRNPKLDTRLQEIELRNKLIGERDPFSVGNSEDRELLRREYDREVSEEDIAKMKGQYTRRGMRDVNNLERNIAIQQKESARQPLIEAQNTNILADKLAMKQRAFDKYQQKEIENFAARYNKKNEDFAKKMQNKLDRHYYKSIGVKPGQKASEADMQLQLNNMQPVQSVLNSPSRNVNEYNLVPNPYKAEEFDKKQLGGRFDKYGKTSYNINPDLDKFDQFNPANNQVKLDGLNLSDNDQLDRWESQRLEPNNWKFDIGERQRTIANQLNNYSNNRNTRLPNFGPAQVNNNKKQSNWLNNTINTLGDWYDDERLEYTGNRVQNRGNMIPAMWNMTKYIGDNPEKEKLVAPAMAYTEKYMTPDILPLLRNKQQNINMIRQNARGTGDIMANIQQLHANTIKQEADVANKVQAANMGQRDKYEQAKQAYLDEYRSEVLRKQATDRANRGDWESLGSKAMTEYGNALRQKGMMLNQEEADRMREDMYLNQLTNDYKVVKDKDGNRYIETVINGKVVNLTPQQHSQYITSITDPTITTTDPNAVRGTATTPVGNNATTTVNRKNGGKTRVRNRLYY